MDRVDSALVVARKAAARAVAARLGVVLASARAVPVTAPAVVRLAALGSSAPLVADRPVVSAALEWVAREAAARPGASEWVARGAVVHRVALVASEWAGAGVFHPNKAGRAYNSSRAVLAIRLIWGKFPRKHVRCSMGSPNAWAVCPCRNPGS